jgi:hypothetical protein
MTRRGDAGGNFEACTYAALWKSELYSVTGGQGLEFAVVQALKSINVSIPNRSVPFPPQRRVLCFEIDILLILCRFAFEQAYPPANQALTDSCDKGP